MVNTTNQPTSSSILPVTPMTQSANSEPVTAFYVKEGNQASGPSHVKQPSKSKSKLPLIGGLVLMLVLILGLLAGLFYMNQQKDSRQQADDTGTGNCRVCDLNNDDNVSANEVSQLGQCIGAQIGQNDGSFCFLNGQVRDPNNDGVLNSADTQICTECLGAVTDRVADSSASPTIPPSSACQAINITDTQTQWLNNYSQIEITWKLGGGQVTDWEIWNIGYGTVETLGADGYYLSKLTSSPLPASSTRFVVTNPNELPTRRFLIRGVLSRTANGSPQCFNQGALCRPPQIDNRRVTTTDRISYNLTWQATQKPHYRYEIWMIGNGTLEQLGEAGYYIVKLADITDINATSAQVTIPETYRSRNTNRFLIRAVNYLDENGLSPCHNQWALGIDQDQPNDSCTLSFTVGSPTATPTSVPGATATPTPTLSASNTPIPSIGCNQVCVTNADCTNKNHICFTDQEEINRCRLETNPTDLNCQPMVAQQPVELPQELPQSGPAEWLTWMKAGLAVLGIGAALLLML